MQLNVIINKFNILFIIFKDNDQSVLENYHLNMFFKILEQSETNLLINLSEGDYRYFRRMCILLILETDL